MPDVRRRVGHRADLNQSAATVNCPAFSVTKTDADMNGLWERLPAAINAIEISRQNTIASLSLKKKLSLKHEINESRKLYLFVSFRVFDLSWLNL